MTVNLISEGVEFDNVQTTFDCASQNPQIRTLLRSHKSSQAELPFNHNGLTATTAVCTYVGRQNWPYPQTTKVTRGGELKPVRCL